MVGSLVVTTEKRFDHLEGLIDSLATATLKGFQRVDERFEKLEGRFDRFEKRMTRVERELDL